MFRVKLYKKEKDKKKREKRKLIYFLNFEVNQAYNDKLCIRDYKDLSRICH